MKICLSYLKHSYQMILFMIIKSKGPKDMTLDKSNCHKA